MNKFKKGDLVYLKQTRFVDDKSLIDIGIIREYLDPSEENGWDAGIYWILWLSDMELFTAHEADIDLISEAHEIK